MMVSFVELSVFSCFSARHSKASQHFGFHNRVLIKVGKLMDRDTLSYLLKSGKYLCFNPLDVDDPGSTVDDRQPSTNAKAQDPIAESDVDVPETEELFDSPLLRNSVFFKEVATDNRTGRLYTSTRILMAFNGANPYEGGPSFEAVPGYLDKYLSEYFGGLSIQLTNHDKCVLEVFNRTPTFDPFMLLAQREYLQRFRSVGDRHFSVSASTSTEVRSIIAMKARQLVQLAASAGVNRDKINATVLALEDAIWLTQTNEGTSRVFNQMGIPLDQEDAILLAWKGISYYEYMLTEFRIDYRNMLKWLGSGDSFPSDIGLMGTNGTTDFHQLRQRAKVSLRNSYLKASDIMRNYQESYNTLVDGQNPKPFHTFLKNAPTHFEQIGMCVGSFGHVNNAWKSLTNYGNLQRPNAENLEKFYRFICDLIEVKEPNLRGFSHLMTNQETINSIQQRQGL